MADFVHLHVHTQYSILDSTIKLESLVKKAKGLGMPAVAMTDHGNLFGVPEFYEMAKAHSLKPIIGCEVYLTNNREEPDKAKLYHLVLLAEDEIGYHNLLKLVSISFLDRSYYNPCIDKELLAQHCKGLIALSGCLHGEIPQLIIREDENSAKRALEDYIEIFGSKNFFLEVQANGIPEQDIANKGLIKLAREYNLSLIATNNCHYLNRRDAFAREVLLCIQTGKTINDKYRRHFFDEFYFKSPDEMRIAFREIPEAIKNTLLVAERCNVDIPLGNCHFPKFPVPQGETPESYFKKQARQGLKRKLAQRGLKAQQYKAYFKRLEYELKVICEKKLASYLLIVADLINYAKKKGIPIGPGRETTASSLVTYALDITDVDPLLHGLFFERFLNTEKTAPDILIDVCMERRKEIFKYIVQKYGNEHTARVITFGEMCSRPLLKNVGKVLGMSHQEVNEIAKLVPLVTLKEAVKSEPRLKKLAKSNFKVKQLLEVAQCLEGLHRHVLMRATLVVISDNKPLMHYSPLYRTTTGEVCTQFDTNGIKKIGLFRLDVLGVKDLTVIQETLDLIKKHRGEDIDLTRIPLDDKPTYDLLCRADTAGVPQLESSGMKELLRRLKPNCFEDLIALIAVYRPSVLASGIVDEFINRKHGRVAVRYPLPQLESILKETYGLILYQEQAMQIALKLAGYTLEQADNLCKIMKNKESKLIATERLRFIKKAVRNGVPKEKAEYVFSLMGEIAGGLDKSHATTFALISYRAAYLKAHYPIEYRTALAGVGL